MLQQFDTSTLKVFRTVKLGTGLRTAEDFRSALTDFSDQSANEILNDPALKDFRSAYTSFTLGDFLDERANKILSASTFTVATEETEVDLVVISGEELNLASRVRYRFPKAVTRETTYRRALGLGLELCSAEVALQLQLQHRDLPLGELFILGMRPIANKIFELVHDRFGNCSDSPLLSAAAGGRSIVWSDNQRWAFVRPRI